MKQFFKLLKYLAFVILSIIILLFAVAEFAEDEIASISVNQINKSFGLPISYGKISFSLLRDFPHATLEINDIWLGSPSSDTSSGFQTDTLANIQKVFVAVKMRPLLQGQQFDIVKIDIEDADGFYDINKKGASNIDFLIDTTQNEAIDTTTSDLKISLRKVSLKNLKLHYRDLSHATSALLEMPEVSINGYLAHGTFESSLEGNARLSNCCYDKSNLCLMKQTMLNFNLAYARDSILIKKASINSDGAEMSVTGKIGLSKNIFTDLKINAPCLDVAELSKYLPGKLINEYGIEQLAGIINLNGTIKGLVSDSLLPNLAFSFNLKEGIAKTKEYPGLSNISLSGTYDNGPLCNNQSTMLTINAFHFETSKSQADLDFQLQNFDQPNYSVALDVNVDLEELKKYVIPDSLVEKVSGTLEVRLMTNGTLPEVIDSTFIDNLGNNSKGKLKFRDVNLNLDSNLSVDSCNFEIDYSPQTLKLINASLQIPTYHVTLDDADIITTFSGKLSNYRSVSVRLDSCRLQTGKSFIEAKGSFSDLYNPTYWLRSRLDLDMKGISEMVPDTLVKSMKGKVVAQIESKGHFQIDSAIENIESLIFGQSKYQVALDNFSFEMPDTLMQANNLSGKLRIANDTIDINDVSGKYAGISFHADSTKIINTYSAFIKKLPVKLQIEGKFGLGHIDYSSLAVFMEEDSTDSATREVDEYDTDNVLTNFSFQAKGTLAVKSIKYNKSVFNDLSCLFNLSDSLYIIDKLKLKAFDGNLDNAIRCELKPNNRSIISFRSNIKKMNISNLLKEFDDFDQEEINHKQLSGLFSTEMNGRVLLLGDSLVMDSIKAKGDMMLEDGGLFNYKRAMELADFTNLDELDNIRFKTMKTKLFIFRNAVYVPQTDIGSNAMDITAYGMQTFGEDYQYHLRIFLGEILHGKTERIRKKQEEMEDNPDEKGSGLTSLFIQSSSIDGKSKNGLDNKKDRFRMKTKINVQEGILNIIFHPLLVDFNTGVKMDVIDLPQEPSTVK
jgi:hypothetical protein